MQDDGFKVGKGLVDQIAQARVRDECYPRVVLDGDALACVHVHALPAVDAGQLESAESFYLHRFVNFQGIFDDAEKGFHESFRFRVAEPFLFSQQSDDVLQIDLFVHAKFIFSGTFHGVVFSILYHKPFKVYLTNVGRIAKVGALLDDLNINNCFIEKDYIFDYDAQYRDIDYSAVQEIIDKKRAISIKYLNGILNTTNP